MLPLGGNKTVSLVEIFDFENIDASNRRLQRADSSNWYLLLKVCTLFGILPPTIGILKPKAIIARTAQSQRHKRKRQQMTITSILYCTTRHSILTFHRNR